MSQRNPLPVHEVALLEQPQTLAASRLSLACLSLQRPLSSSSLSPQRLGGYAPFHWKGRPANAQQPPVLATIGSGDKHAVPCPRASIHGGRSMYSTVG